MARFVISTIIFAVCQVLILKLAFWQVDRLAWKETIIAKLGAVYQQDATKNNLSFDEWRKAPKQELYFARGVIKGSYLHNKEIVFGPRQREGMNGYHLLVPFRLVTGEHVLVNRGWVPDGLKDQQYRSDGLTEGEIALVGMLRTPERTHFMSPSNVPSQDLWFVYDLEQMGRAIGMNSLPNLVFYVEEELDQSFEYPSAFAKDWYPRNEHFQYMVFWFSMSAALLLIFLMAVVWPLYKNNAKRL